MNVIQIRKCEDIGWCGTPRLLLNSSRSETIFLSLYANAIAEGGRNEINYFFTFFTSRPGIYAWALGSPCAHLATFSLLASLQFWKIFSGIVGASGEEGVQFIRIEGYSFLTTHNW